jgi:hypothetical protein
MLHGRVTGTPGSGERKRVASRLRVNPRLGVRLGPHTRTGRWSTTVAGPERTEQAVGPPGDPLWNYTLVRSPIWRA